MRIAFLTCSREAALHADDHVVRAALEARGVEVVPWVWDGASVAPVDAAVVRSCWDYPERTEDFLAFVSGCVEHGVRLFNPAAAIRWNVDKAYLRDLEARGARVPKTAWIGRTDRGTLAEVLDANGLDEVVIKPRVSGGALDTFRASRATAAGLEATFSSLSARKALLVQEFVPEVARGEISLVYFGGRFSHAVRKTPAAGDFRVQSEHGGTRERVEPRAEWVAEAERVVASLPPLLYARIDVIDASSSLWWMELEAIEPELFFSVDPGSPARFADALERAVATADAPSPTSPPPRLFDDLVARRDPW